MSMFKAVGLDWIGTMIDFGSVAPTGVSVAAFEKSGITKPGPSLGPKNPRGSARGSEIPSLRSAPKAANSGGSSVLIEKRQPLLRRTDSALGLRSTRGSRFGIRAASFTFSRISASGAPAVSSEALMLLTTDICG
jgi:hypothetical protein